MKILHNAAGYLPFIAALINQQKPVEMDHSALTSNEQQPEECYATTTPNQQSPPCQASALEPQPMSPGSQQQTEPGNALCPAYHIAQGKTLGLHEILTNKTLTN